VALIGVALKRGSHEHGCARASLMGVSLMGVALTSVPLTGASLMGVPLVSVPLMSVPLISVSLMSVPLKCAYHRQLISMVNIGPAVERAKGHMRYVDRRNL
jgi:hypothetical protein